jgi:hypothetical protein
MPFITLYDTDVLFPNAQRDLLIRIGMSGLVQAKWTERIIDDLGRVLGRAHPDMPAARVERLKARVLSRESISVNACPRFPSSEGSAAGRSHD